MGMNCSITAANTVEELDQAIAALRAVWAILHAPGGAKPERRDVASMNT